MNAWRIKWNDWFKRNYDRILSSRNDRDWTNLEFLHVLHGLLEQIVDIVEEDGDTDESTQDDEAWRGWHERDQEFAHLKKVNMWNFIIYLSIRE